MQLHRLVFALALVGCTKDSGRASSTGSGSAASSGSSGSSGSAAIAPRDPPPPPPPPPPNDRRVRVPADPPAVASIAFVCDPSDMPFGNGSQMQMSVYDLERAIWTKDSTNTPSTKDDKPPGPDGTKLEHSNGKLSPARLLVIRAAVAKVLAGGPYEPEYPVPEGVSCHMTLSGATGDPFFRIDKANREKKDAVNDLLNAL
jgi:hypothetical protein